MSAIMSDEKNNHTGLYPGNVQSRCVANPADRLVQELANEQGN